MNFSLLNNNILIINDSVKSTILKKINSEKELFNIKIITLSEFKNKYFFEYDNETIDYVVKNYNVIYEVAKVYLDNLYFVNEVVDEKTEFLLELKNTLLKKGLLKENKIFRLFLKGKKIFLYNLNYVDNFYIKTFDELKKCSEIIYINDNNNFTKKELYAAETKEDEIAFVASEICKLIKSGVDINKIKLANVQEDYHFVIWKTFKLFNIPVELKSSESFSGSLIVNKFKELYSNNIIQTLDSLKQYVLTPTDEKVYNKIVDLLNGFAWCSSYEDIKYLVFKELDMIKTSSKKLENAVKIVDFPCGHIESDEYVFLVNFNQGVIPREFKDEDYLSDSIKKKIGISTSCDLNKKELIMVKEAILKAPHLVLSYSKRDLSNELYISNAYEDTCDIKPIDMDFVNSDSYNLIKLLSLKDENKKYGTVSDKLLLLNKHYNGANYMNYDNSFKGVDPEKIWKHSGEKLTMSYSSMNTYYQCGFRYYLQNVLKLDKFEDSFQTVIGNIFHKILSECFEDENYDIDSAYEREMRNSNYIFDEMEKFFIRNLKTELIMIIDVIKAQMENTTLKNSLYEQEIIIDIDKGRSIRFKGFVDKILYGEHNGNIIAAIIDYKTGNPELSLNNVIYGLDMQLPIYIYLVKNSDKIRNVKIGGFYLQKILNSVGDLEKKKEALKLQGYSNSDLNILEAVDKTYVASENIKSLRMSSNGFYAYSKVLNDNEIDKLSNLVEEKIYNAKNEILNANFKINPKEIGSKMVGCKFCKFKDICYMNNKDIIKYDDVNIKDFLGGDIND